MRLHTSLLITCALAVTTTAGAQPSEPQRVSREPATAFLLTGLTLGPHEAGPLLGGTFSTGLAPRVSIEASAGVAERGNGVQGVFTTGAVTVRLGPPLGPVRPFVSLGGGVYRERFDLGSPRMTAAEGWVIPAGMAGGAIWPGMTFGGSTWLGPGRWSMGPRHMSSGMLPAGARGSLSFTNPVLVAGAGARIRFGRRAVVRPEAKALVVLANGRPYTVGLLSLGLGLRVR